MTITPARPPAAAALRAWRKRLGLRQRAAAAALGLGLAAYGRYERGARRIPLAVMLAAAARERLPAALLDRFLSPAEPAPPAE